MTRIRSALVALALFVALTIVSPAGAVQKPRCHWETFTRHGMHYYIQVCTFPKKRHHKVDPRWTHAGPDNSPAPHIG